MTYYTKYGYVVDAKETIAYSSPIKQFRKTKHQNFNSSNPSNNLKFLNGEFGTLTLINL
jgi:hypothetical protein